MSYVLNCASCGKKLLEYEPNSVKYGDPIRCCKKCGREYLDPRYHELAIVGFPQTSFKILPDMILLIVGGLFVWRGIYLYGMKQLNSPEETQWLLPTIILLLGAVMAVAAIVDMIRILTGSKRRKYERLMEESHKRLLDPEYARKLSGLGYPVPDGYTNGGADNEEK